MNRKYLNKGTHKFNFKLRFSSKIMPEQINDFRSTFDALFFN